jgi:hypothetical protein
MDPNPYDEAKTFSMPDQDLEIKQRIDGKHWEVWDDDWLWFTLPGSIPVELCATIATDEGNSTRPTIRMRLNEERNLGIEIGARQERDKFRYVANVILGRS